MKLFCSCYFCGNKNYLISDAKSRKELLVLYGQNFSLNCIRCKSQNQFNLNEVTAESSLKNVSLSATLGGGLIGILAGPLGVAIGLLAGRTVGGLIRSNDEKAASVFNDTHL